VTALLIMLSSLSAGISHNVVESATTLSAGHVNVAGFYKTHPTDSSPIITNKDEIRSLVEENTPGLDYVIDRHRGWAKVVSETGSLQVGLTGINPAQEEALFEAIQLAPRSAYVEGGGDEVDGDLSRLKQPKTALLFATQAKQLGVQVGDPLTIRGEMMRGGANTVDVTVVAVAEDVGLLSSFSIFVPRETILDLYQLQPHTTGAIQVYLDDIDDADEVAAHLRSVLSQNGHEVMEPDGQPFYMKFDAVSAQDWVGQKLDITTWEDEVSFLQWILTGLNSISFTLIAILIAIIAVGIMNTMLMSVRERTQEIGTLRAIGMHKRSVLAMFMLEAIILGLGATLTGATAGALVSIAIDAAEIRVPIDALRAILLSDTINMRVDLTSLFGSVLILTFFTMLSALWPAIRAARMQPITAIHKVD
jgi:putative ABC transport system permease protein